MNGQETMQGKQADERPRLSRLVLTGFMGAGKSTVGAILARSLGWRFLDLDAVIEATSKLTVGEIFTQHGEAVFRQRERRALEDLSQEHALVLALGGGTLENESSRTLLTHSPETSLVFLEGRLTDLIARCTAEGKVRPLLAAPEVMEARHERRLPYYRLAHVTVLTTGLEPHQVADQVIASISARWQVERRTKVDINGDR
jgi:shikimate kinase